MAKRILIVVEQKNGVLRKAACELLGYGKKLADTLAAGLTAVVLGDQLGDVAAEIGCYGVDKIIAAESKTLANYSTEAYTDVLGKILGREQADYVFLSHTAAGKDLAPRVAQRLNAGLASDCTGVEVVEGDLVFKRPIYAGKAFAKMSSVNSQPVMATFRPNALGMSEPAGNKGPEIIQVPAEVDPGLLRALVREIIGKSTGRVELTEADIIISGGRGMKGPENFAVLEELADILGAAVGASRAAVDAGWREHAFQVGQTGKTVSPTLYIACGISGAIQHLAGMGSSKVIVAINKDPEANIFKVADYGIVGDLFQVVPVLTQEFKKFLTEQPA